MKRNLIAFWSIARELNVCALISIASTTIALSLLCYAWYLTGIIKTIQSIR